MDWSGKRVEQEAHPKRLAQLSSTDVLRTWIKHKSSGNRGARHVKGPGDRSRFYPWGRQLKVCTYLPPPVILFFLWVPIYVIPLASFEQHYMKQPQETQFVFTVRKLVRTIYYIHNSFLIQYWEYLGFFFLSNWSFSFVCLLIL